MTVSERENVGAVALAVLSGAICLVFLGYVSSYVTPDDVYAKQTTSLFGDQRIISGYVYLLAQGAFSFDVGFRLIVIFAMGFTGYFFFARLAENCGFDKIPSAFLALGAITSFGFASYTFFYDIYPLYYALAFPALAYWLALLTPKTSLLRYFVATFVLCVFLLGTLQLYVYWLFLILAAMLFFKTGSDARRHVGLCAATALAAVLAFILVTALTRTDAYVAFTGFPLRNRLGASQFAGMSILEIGNAYAATSLRFPLFKFNSFGLHVFLLTFIALRTLTRDPAKLAWRSASLLSLAVAVYFSPFMFSAEMANNPRVFQSLYVWGAIAYVFMAARLVVDEGGAEVFSVLTSTIAAALIAVAVAWAVSFQGDSPGVTYPTYAAVAWMTTLGKSFDAPAYATYFSVLLAAALSASVVAAIGMRTSIVFFCTLLSFYAVEIQRSINITDRWKGEDVFDRAIVDGIAAAIVDNHFRFGSQKWIIEYGRRKTFLSGTAVKSYYYSAESFWQNSMPALGWRTIFKRNDAVCRDQGDYGVFKVIESNPGHLKVCL